MKLETTSGVEKEVSLAGSKLAGRGENSFIGERKVSLIILAKSDALAFTAI